MVEEGAAGEEDALDSADVADDVAEMVSDEEGEAQQVSAQDDRSELLRGQKVCARSHGGDVTSWILHASHRVDPPVACGGDAGP